MCMDVKYFYLNNHIDRDEYIMIQISMIPQESVDKYNHTGKANNGYIYERVTIKNVWDTPSRSDIA